MPDLLHWQDNGNDQTSWQTNNSPSVLTCLYIFNKLSAQPYTKKIAVEQYKAKRKRVFTQNYKYILHYYKKKRILRFVTRRSPGTQGLAVSERKVVLAPLVIVFFVFCGKPIGNWGDQIRKMRWTGRNPHVVYGKSFKLFRESAVSGTLNSVNMLP